MKNHKSYLTNNPPNSIISLNGQNWVLSKMVIEELVKLLVKHKFPVFSLEDLCTFYPKVKYDTLKKSLFRWKKKGWIAGLRRGLYELTFPSDLKLPDLYLANKIYAPSYVSLETALSNYGIIPEVAMAVTSVTSKPTRRFKNQHGLFIYRTIQPQAFCGYQIEKHNGHDVLIAEPEKALVDYLYLNTCRNTKFDAAAQRLDRKKIKKMNPKKIQTYAALYKLNLKQVFYANL